MSDSFFFGVKWALFKPECIKAFDKNTVFTKNEEKFKKTEIFSKVSKMGESEFLRLLKTQNYFPKEISPNSVKRFYNFPIENQSQNLWIFNFSLNNPQNQINQENFNALEDLEK